MDAKDERLHEPLRIGRLRLVFTVQGFDKDWSELKGVRHTGNTLWPLVRELTLWQHGSSAMVPAGAIG